MLGETREDDLFTDRKLNLKFGAEQKSIVASFFYNARSQRTNVEISHAHMLQSMLFQLLKQEEDLFPLFRERYIELKRELSNKSPNRQTTQSTQQEWPFDMLLGILRNIIKLKDRSCILYIFVDAMDESKSDGRDLILSLLTRQDSFQVKTMIASRPIKDLMHEIDHKIILEDCNSNDITRIVEARVASWMQLIDANEILNYKFNILQKKVIHDANGVILWVSLVLGVIQALFDYGPPPPDTLMETLGTLPPDLEDLYVTIINRLSSSENDSDIPKGKQWLEWAAFSARLLDLNEFRDAIAVSELDVDYDGTIEALIPKRFPPGFKAADGNLRRLCGGFIELKDLRGTVLFESIQSDDYAVQLLHQTVKHFLGTKKAGLFTCLKQEGDALIAKTCSRYLLSLSKLSFLPSIQMKQTTAWEDEDYKSFIIDLDKRPLLVYVFAFLPCHLTCEEDLKSLGKIIETVWMDQPARYLLSSWATHLLSHLDPEQVQSLHPEKWHQFWSQFSDVRLSKEERQFLLKFKNMSIVAAVRADCRKAVKALLAIGAVVDMDDDFNGISALSAAAEEQRWDMHAYLSEFAQSRLTIQESKAENTDSQLPSDNATIYPPPRRVESFSLQDKTQISYALHAAATTGNISRLRRLLDAGADPDSRRIKDGLSPLHLATTNNHIEAMTVLLDAGGDVNSADNTGVTPLMIAASKGSIDAATILLKYGANLKATSTQGNTAFSLAKTNNQPGIIWLFRESEINMGPVSVSSTPIFLVPFSRPELCFGRESVLIKMDTLLHSHNNQPVALAGLGGIGYVQRIFCCVSSLTSLVKPMLLLNMHIGRDKETQALRFCG